jgi:hypothetical protein
MKKILLLSAALLGSLGAFAQDCSELFISEYVEGTYNNHAIEIYNPTANAINLGGYSLGRFSNGSSTLTTTTLFRLPNRMIQPYTTFVVGANKGGTNPVDTAQGTVGSGSENPLFNGYQVMYLAMDNVTMTPRLGSRGDSLYKASTYGGTTVNKFNWGTTYNSRWDLRSHIDSFACPVYATNNVLYHNGNDAMALIKGAALTSPVVDAVGILGDASISAAAGWSNTDPNALPYDQIVTKDHTLIRKATIKQGKVLNVSTGASDFNVEDYEVYSENYFLNLGHHTCDCFIVGTVQQKAATQFTLYPNPISRGFVTLRSNEGINIVTVTNALGQLVKTEKMSGTGTEQIDMNGVLGGVYIVNVTFVNGTQTAQKIVVQ